ncbi:MAG: hypothetical protein C0615_00230 [Desulfuromonas sp.]|nr:MAG: hypothetical protein C0615_00230 [Desulfuromonas sp.]
MRLSIRRILSPIIILLLSVMISGCPGKPDSMRTVEKQSYIDARRGFTISYPQPWAAYLVNPGIGPYAENSVRWEIKPTDDSGADLTLTIVALRHYGFTPESVSAEVLQDFYPNLVTVARKEVKLAGGKATLIDGHTPHRTIRSWVFDIDHQLFLIIYTAPPETFDRQANLFSEVAESFRALP